jgi:O-antigen/teichoic acid export membrane protein
LRNYQQDFGLMHIFTFGIIGAILLRIPLGNILAASGWVKVNTVNSLIIAVLNLILSYVAIEHFGIIGAAYVTSGLLWLSGVFSLIAFIFYLKRN